MNIIISGWPATGSSTAAKFIALTLDMKYLYGGGMLRYWAESMGYDPKTNEISKWTDKYGIHWDKFWDKYAKWKIENAKNIIIDAKTLGFFVEESSKIKEVFLIASTEARKKRISSDKRTEDISIRDKMLRESWFKAYKFDIFDIASLKKHYDFVLDSTHISIPEVSLRILEFIDSKNLRQFEQHRQILTELVQKYYKAPRTFLTAELEKRNLYVPKEEIITEWNSSEFSEIINELPIEMRKAISLV